tara:strand:- start:72 stop:1193 length:1122 start_codon:yes stop_codon:yes gene_type:complete
MNLDDFFLCENDKKKIKDWLKTFDKPLFISGTTGIGKSLLVDTILKDYNIINIDHKLNKNIIEYIDKSIHERDISMMFSTRKMKCILFDNIFYTDRIIISYLKKLVSKKSKIPKIPFIIISNDFTNKKIENISNKCVHIYLKYNMTQYKSIVYKKYDNISDDLIFKSKYNIHTIESNIDSYDKNSFIDSSEKDINVLTNNFTNDNTLNELFVNYSCDYNIVALNILDDITNKNINNIDSICKIYESILIYDNYEMFRNKYYISDNILSIFYSICLPYMIIKLYKLKLSENIKYNSYMSKSFIYTHLNDLDISKYNIYFDTIRHLLTNDSDISKYFIDNNCNKKIFNNYIKLYELIYNKTICKNKIKKFNNLIT